MASVVPPEGVSFKGGTQHGGWHRLLALLGAKYLDAALKDSNKRWGEEWIVELNPALSLPTQTSYPPILKEKWEGMPSEDEMVQVRVLLAVDVLPPCPPRDTPTW
jgi:hypothetical protein